MPMTADQFQRDILPLKDKLFAVALRYLRNREESRDAVQDVFVRFWEYRSEWSRLRNVEAMLVTMTRNRCLDLLKKSGGNAHSIDAVFDLSDGQSPPDTQAEHLELKAQWHAFVATLPSDQRKMLELRDGKQYTYEEIAAETGKTMSSVKVTLHRARMALRKHFEAMYAYDTTRK